MDLDTIKNKLINLEERNKVVDLNKKWETSITRKLSVACITYVCAAALMYSIGIEEYGRNALIPTLGYLLSTLSLPFIRTIWERR